jgi:DNA-binding NtrC family response regulator
VLDASTLELALSASVDPRANPGPAEARTDLYSEVESLERARILEALERCHGNQTRAAELLGMPRRTLVARLARLGVSRPRARTP